MSGKPIFEFRGNDADVLWDERLCIHVGECGRATGELFVGGRQPWCQPDLVTVEEVKEVVERCPSGALTYRIKDGSISETVVAENTIHVTHNGPLYARGDLRITGAAADMPGVAFRAALCRCGQSKNKPFCDNSHEAAGFKDSGAVGDSGEADAATGGPLTITTAKDGPLLLAGNVTIVAASGRRAWSSAKAALCRCGASKNKPFCDGSHKAAAFRAD